MIRIIITYFFILSYALSGERIAIATKIIGNAHFVRGNGSKSVIKKGQIFETGDILSTTKGGFVALLFIDDKTALKIKEKASNSHYTILIIVGLLLSVGVFLMVKMTKKKK